MMSKTTTDHRNRGAKKGIPHYTEHGYLSTRDKAVEYGMSYKEAARYTHIRKLYRELEAGWSRMRDDVIENRLAELETKILATFHDDFKAIQERHALRRIAG